MKINLDDSMNLCSPISLKEKVDVAERLKKKGKCDLIRGQIEQFPLQPSILRPNVDRKIEAERLNGICRTGSKQ